MLIDKWLPRLSFIGLFLVLVAATSGPASANVLANPGFESGLAGWITFGNVYPEAANPPAIVPLNGNGVAKMFGGFSGGFNVGGMFQEFPASPGMHWQMASFARHWSGDPLVGALPSGNWVVQKIVFKDAGDAEIGAAESVILDGTSAPDAWHPAPAIIGIAPAGTVQVEAFILFLQPAFDGGAAQIDDVSLTDVTPVPAGTTSWGRVKAQYKD
jgi:hypothetical protein